MMTIKQAKSFSVCCRLGDRPPLPKDHCWLLYLSPAEIKDSISREKVFDYGNRAALAATRLRQMGLMDENFNLTDLGREYIHK